MAIRSVILRKIVALAACSAARIARRTIDWRIQYCDPRVEPGHPDCVGRMVFATWHENVLIPAIMRGNRKMLALASQHGDGDIISRAMKHLNWSMVRGSTSRGGVSALIKMLREDDRNLNIAPDGPRGPRRVMSMGVVFLASKLGYPLVCYGGGYERPWRLNSWDRFAVPRPFTRIRSIVGPPVYVPGGLDREAMEAYRQWFEDLLTWLSDEAEQWATTGQRREGEFPMPVGKMTPDLINWKPSDAPVLPANLATRLQALEANHEEHAGLFPRLARAS